jgi:hypothetical protein
VTQSRRSNFTRREVLGLLAAGVGLLPSLAYADPWAAEAAPSAIWMRTTSSDVSVRAGPDVRAERLRLVRTGTALRILGTMGDWRFVHDPHADISGYVHADLLVAADAPAQFAFLPDLPLEEELSTVAIATQQVAIYFYPSNDELAQATGLDAGDRETIVGTVTGDDGATWFRTDDGYYLPSDGLFIGAAPHDFAGRWLDVSLSGAAQVMAYDDNVPVRSFHAIKGTARFPTPPGTWAIVRRVANETMDSTTIGIPRNAPGGYFLKNVLYTQYFRGTGESLHYNWWSSAWGAPGSHGCLGLSLADSRWLWNWATVGTPVAIHA